MALNIDLDQSIAKHTLNLREFRWLACHASPEFRFCATTSFIVPGNPWRRVILRKSGHAVLFGNPFESVELQMDERTIGGDVICLCHLYLRFHPATFYAKIGILS